LQESIGEALDKHTEILRRAGIQRPDVLSGGFPCQDISQAGEGRGIDEGERSGLWREQLRSIDLLRPGIAVVENVSALLERDLGRVLGGLAEIGYDAEWDSLPAAAFGAPHIRDRVWILAYPGQKYGSYAWRNNPDGRRKNLLPEAEWREATEWNDDRELITLVPGVHPGSPADWWLRQSRVARSVNGLPRELVDARNGALGNAVVPDIAEWIGRRIVANAALTREREAEAVGTVPCGQADPVEF
jgi:DNA (cytosine-5)-methyltransferase 1